MALVACYAPQVRHWISGHLPADTGATVPDLMRTGCAATVKGCLATGANKQEAGPTVQAHVPAPDYHRYEERRQHG